MQGMHTLPPSGLKARQGGKGTLSSPNGKPIARGYNMPTGLCGALLARSTAVCCNLG